MSTDLTAVSVCTEQERMGPRMPISSMRKMWDHRQKKKSAEKSRCDIQDGPLVEMKGEAAWLWKGYCWLVIRVVGGARWPDMAFSMHWTSQTLLCGSCLLYLCRDGIPQWEQQLCVGFNKDIVLSVFTAAGAVIGAVSGLLGLRKENQGLLQGSLQNYLMNRWFDSSSITACANAGTTMITTNSSLFWWRLGNVAPLPFWWSVHILSGLII